LSLDTLHLLLLIGVSQRPLSYSLSESELLLLEEL
jgi:hypothetical protein